MIPSTEFEIAFTSFGFVTFNMICVEHCDNADFSTRDGLWEIKHKPKPNFLPSLATVLKIFEDLAKSWDGLDSIIHSIAFAPREALTGDYLEGLSRESFQTAHDISSFSFSALAKAGFPLMKNNNGSLLTLSYLGSQRVMPNYNVMGLAKASLEANVRFMASSLGPKGIRVNAISAGPIKTLASAGIGDFGKLLGYTEKISPLRRNVSIEEVGNVAAFLCSDLASGVTGEITYVDAGFNNIAFDFIE